MLPSPGGQTPADLVGEHVRRVWNGGERVELLHHRTVSIRTRVPAARLCPIRPAAMSEFPNHDVEPFDTGPLLWWVLGLLGAALGLEFLIAVPWTAPFADPGTWVLIGVFVGFALRVTGRHLQASDYGGELILRWASLVVWALAAVGGLLAWIL